MNEGSWQPDPTHRHELRWWDGQAWTDHVSDQGVTSVDPPTYVATEPTTPAPTGPAPTAWGAPGAGFGAAPTPSPANDDTVHRPTAIQPPPVGSAPRESILPQFTNEAAAQPSKPRTGLIVAALAGVLAVGVAAFLLLSGGDDEKTSGGTDTTAIVDTTEATGTTAVTDTSEATTSTEAATTTTPAPSSADVLLASLPTLDDVPAGWSLIGDTFTDPLELEGPGIGLCGGFNLVSVALRFGSAEQVYGPVFEIADGGTITIDAYNFPDAASATSFLSATGGIINECAAPVTYQQPESEFDLLNDGTGDTALWSLSETGSAGFLEPGAVEERLGTVINTAASTTIDTGVSYGLTITDLTHFERTGNVVVVYKLRGYHTYLGGDPEWAFNPTQEDISADIETVRPTILARLAENGFI